MLETIDWPADPAIDQMCDWLDTHIRHGSQLRCEDVLDRYPQWRDDPEAALDLIYTEYSARCQSGTTPAPTEFYERFPQWQRQLEHQFQLADLFDSEASRPEATGTSSARYRVVKLLARGGIGQVMQAIDTELNREVAVKEIQSQLVDDIAVRERFLREAEITGQLEHPGIVPVYGLGSDEQERPFYAMRLVRGQSLLEAIKDFHGSAGAQAFRSLQFQNLLRRFLSVCDTLSYAHSRGVIHRDIKPENILLGPFGETLVVDWGVAKVTPLESTPVTSSQQSTKSVHSPGSMASTQFDSEQLGHSSGNSPANWSVELTQSAGTLVGTPAYMSPEQARGDSANITAASDIYSLGATLHLLLTGQPRFSTNDLGAALRSILSDDLPTPRMLNRRIPRRLDAICTKALKLNPAERYTAVSDMARDIEHYLADEPVTALRESALARIIRLTRRYRTLAFSSVVSMMILTAIVFVAAMQIDRERQQTNEAFQAAERGNARLAFDRGYQLLETHQFGEGLLWLQRALSHVPASDETMRRVILTNMAAARSHLVVRQAVFDNQESLSLFEFDILGKHLVTADRKGRVRYWNADDGTMVVEYQLPQSRILATDIDAQGLARIVAAKGHTLTAYTLSDTQAPTKIWEAEQDGTIHHALLTSHGHCAVACSNRDQSWQVCVLDALDGQPIATIPVASEVQLIFDDVRSRLISIDERKTALFWKWQADRQEYQLAGSLENVLRLAFSADGKWIAIGTLQGGISCYGAESLKLQQVVGQFLGSVVALAISPDSEVLVAVWDNGVSRAWNLQDWQPACESLRVDRYTNRMLFRPKSRQLALLAKPHVVALWQLPQSNQTSLPLSIRNIDSIEYSGDGALAIVASRNRFAYFVDGATGRIVGKPMGHRDVIKTACFHPDGGRALSASYDGRAILWNTDSGTPAVTQLQDSAISKSSLNNSTASVLDETKRLNAAAFSPDGRWIATLDNIDTVRIWDAATGVSHQTLVAKSASALEVCFSPSSQQILVGYNSPDCGVRLWDVQTGKLLWTGKHTAGVRCVAISPNGQVAVSGGNDSTARLWSTDTGAALAELPARGEVFVARFHPHRNLVATAGYDATIRFWEVPTGALIGEPMMHQALVTDFVFSHDGLRLLSGAIDRTARLWDVDTCLPLSPPLHHDNPLMSVALHPHASIALTGRLWQLPTALPDEPELIRHWTRLATQRTFTSGNNNFQWLSSDEVNEEAMMFQALAGCSWKDWPER